MHDDVVAEHETHGLPDAATEPADVDSHSTMEAPSKAGCSHRCRQVYLISLSDKGPHEANSPPGFPHCPWPALLGLSILVEAKMQVTVAGFPCLTGTGREGLKGKFLRNVLQ